MRTMCPRPVAKLVVPLVIASALMAHPSPAAAASFDCTKATSPREHLICGTDDLSKADDRLAALYKTKLALLGVDGATLLRNAERSWFAFVDTTCRLRPNAPAGRLLLATPAKCLARAYDDRTKQLSQTGPSGPYVFVRVDIYTARPTTGAVGDAAHEPGFDTRHVAYFQIDRPGSVAARAWNRKAQADAAPGRAAEDDSDLDRDVTLGYVTRGLISLRLDDYEYGHGMAHGTSTASVWNARLGNTLGILVPADIFGAGQVWKSALGDIGLSAIEENGWEPREPDAETQMRAEITDPAHWLIRPDGLEIVFSSYDGGCYSCTPKNGLISWSRLRPLLSPAFVDMLPR